MTNGISVKKRNGRGSEPLYLEKMHKMVEQACKDLAGVSESQVEMNSNLNSPMVLRHKKFKRFLLDLPVI